MVRLLSPGMSTRRDALKVSFAGALSLAAFSMPAVAETQAVQNEAQERAEIEAVLKSYEQSLNAGDVKGVMQLYTEDGVLLAPNAPSAVGSEAVRNAYTGIFQAIGLNIAFKIAEVKFLSPEWAFLRTNSAGTVKILANGAQVPGSNQELFVLQKGQGSWKIARYSFSSILPPAK
jgi:uncharacterized protein (TIGR02246 family)